MNGEKPILHLPNKAEQKAVLTPQQVYESTLLEPTAPSERNKTLDDKPPGTELVRPVQAPQREWGNPIYGQAVSRAAPQPARAAPRGK